MLHSILITGGNEKKRLKKALSLHRQFNHLTMKQFDNDPDFIFISSETSIGIEEVRQLKSRLNRKPFQASFKTAFINEAHKLTIPAQNSLLKVLEEPPARTLIILSVDNPEVLLPTVQSRCQKVNLSRQKPNNLNNEEVKTELRFISGLIEKRAGERLLLIQPYLKNRQIAAEFCKKTISVLEPLLFTGSKNLNQKQIPVLLKSLQKTHQLLQKNVNTKLALENMVLSW